MDKHVDPNAQVGLRIRLISMDDEQPIDAQMEGTINKIDDIGTIHVRWDDGRTLGVIPGVDEYQLLPSESDQVGIEVFESDGPITKKYSQEFKRIHNTSPKIELESKVDKVKGGVSDKLSVQDIAKKHKSPIGDIRKEIKSGIKIELEHTKDKSLAKEIAMDHVSEFSDFYSNPKHGAIASEKGLEKIHESTKEEFKTALQRIISTINTAKFQHKDTVDNMIDNFYHKYKGGVEDSDKFNEIYTNLKEKLESKFEIGETTAAAGGGSTGAFVGPLRTEKNENKIIKIDDLLNEVSRVNRLRGDGGFDGNAWVGDKDGNGWLFDDDPAWEGGEIVDILSKLDINWKDEDLTVTTNESLQNAIKGLVSEGNKQIIDDLTLDGFDTVSDEEDEELAETTTFASALGTSGTYVGAAFAAKKGEHGPSKKPIWKGGTIVQDIKSDDVLVSEINDVKFVKDAKYVKLKDKCTKYNNQPFCDEGNASDPLELSDSTMESIDNISETHGISRETILEKIKSKVNR